jgi:hypothetical protein
MNISSVTIIVASLAGFLLLQGSSPSEEIWAWVAEVEGEVWDRVAIATGPEDLEPLGEDDEWWVLVSAHDGYSHQWQFLIRKPWRSDPSVRYLHLEENLSSQLAELRRRDPQITSERAASRIAAAHGELTLDNCPGLEGVGEGLAIVETRVLPPSGLVLHPVAYTVDVISAFRDDRRIVVYEGDGPLSTWCSEAIETVLACARKPAN